jgi:hypothetical protein
MSSSIWTLCEGDCEVKSLRLEAWRAVEAQHQVSTRKLVDSLEEQRLLEDLLERSKPSDPAGGRLHYLLATPFRYPPLRYGSRFGSRHERGIWYGGQSRRTVLAEVAYYRLVFREGTRADLGTVSTPLTLFRAGVRTARGADLCAPPFDRHSRTIASPVSYDETQALGRAMRETGVDAFRYPSARDSEGGVGIGVFSTAAFGRARPRAFESWHCTTSRERVEVVERTFGEPSAYVFGRDAFLMGGVLPAPAA